MELLTARDKLPQIEQQVRSAEMERYVLSIRIQFDPGPLPGTASDFEKAAHQALKAEADGSRAGIILWDRKLSVLRPIYDKLKAEMDAQEKTAVTEAM